MPTEQNAERESSGHDAAFVELGMLLLEAGLSVTDVRDELETVRRTAAPDEPLSFEVLADTVFVSRARGTGPVAMGSIGQSELPVRQAARAVRFSHALASGERDLAEVAGEARRIRDHPAPHGTLGWIGGCVLIAAGLATVFRCPWWAILLAALVGCAVGAVIRLMSRSRPAAAILPFVATFLSTLLVGAVAAWADLGPVPLFAVCAPIAILVPGALITNALLELTANDIVTGASRLVYGLIVLGFMVLGILAGGAPTGLRIDPGSASLVGDAAALGHAHGTWTALPPQWAAWVGVVGVAIGISLALGSGSRLTALAVVVMTCTYAVLSILTPHVGSIVATGVSAAVLFAAARLLERSGFSVPAAITFQPAFLLLVPGTVGLVAITASSGEALATAPATFVSLCIGIKVGSVITDTPWARVFTRRAAIPG
ncbi:threonine/serine exporter family protein [Leucobacter celer]|jgi:uncharacterized membrane protein YjjP (DUF1212 family)|uniref:threonine/serine exporter family protein n=1 Tax=Leucobacter celer TaxID=668625 RepID=UPI0006A79ADB|nr:threonine/serine exporter family protein [Leucobacter celer]